MKKYLSVFMLIVRNSFYKLLSILLLTAGIQIVTSPFIFRGIKDVFSSHFHALFSGDTMNMLLLTAAVSFILSTLWLSWLNYRFSRNYTALRLRISGRAFYTCQTIYSILFFLLFWALQVLTASLSVLLYCQHIETLSPGLFNPGTPFLIFQAQDYLHALLPFEDWWIWTWNGLFTVLLGTITAHRPSPDSSFGHIKNFSFLIVLPILFAGITHAALSVFHRILITLFLLVHLASSLLFNLRKEVSHEA